MQFKSLLSAAAVMLCVTSCITSPKAQSGVEISTQFPITTCDNSTTIESQVEELMETVLKARNNHDSDPEIRFKDYMDTVYELLQSTNPNALEAQVALMAYYIGEHPGDALLDVVVRQGEAGNALVQQYKSCRPQLSFESEVSDILAFSTSYQLYESSYRRWQELNIPK